MDHNEVKLYIDLYECTMKKYWSTQPTFTNDVPVIRIKDFCLIFRGTMYAVHILPTWSMFCVM